MADSVSDANASTDRRNRRTERRRRRIRLFATVMPLVLLAGLVLVATDLVRFGGGERPSLAGTVNASGKDDSSATVTTTKSSKAQCRSLSTTDPLRLWVGGDSLAGTLGPSLGTIAGATGVVQPYFDSRVSSGLADPGFFDWPTHATTEMATINPEIVAFIIGANDWTNVSGDAWKADYTQKVDEMMKVLIGPGRTVYWIGSPTLRDPKMDAAVVEVNAVAAEVAKRHPEVHYIDAYKLFSGADGKFALDLPDETGKVVTMRSSDGVHLTMAGGDYLARTLFKLIDDQCRVTAQKVDGAVKPTIQAEGSTQVAPSSNSGSSSGSSSGNNSGSSGGGTIATTPPATVPPTDPPTTSSPPVSSVPPPSTTATTMPDTQPGP